MRALQTATTAARSHPSSMTRATPPVQTPRLAPIPNHVSCDPLPDRSDCLLTPDPGVKPARTTLKFLGIDLSDTTTAGNLDKFGACDDQQSKRRCYSHAGADNVVTEHGHKMALPQALIPTSGQFCQICFTQNSDIASMNVLPSALSGVLFVTMLLCLRRQAGPARRSMEH